MIVVMAKAPEPGRVKTRLCPPLDPDRAAALAGAFIEDTWRVLASLDVPAAIAYDGDPTHLPDGHRWPQPPGDLGARIEDTLRRGLGGADRVVVIGSDAPGLPAPLLESALAHLRTTDAVIGPAVDGGYYLIGARRVSPGLLADLPWSQPDTCAATSARLRDRGYSLARLPVWFDVDEAGDLPLLRAALAANLVSAPATAALLEDLP